MLERNEISVHKEVGYIINRARAGDARVVTLGSLVFFSTWMGDSWMLDPEDGLALCLVRDREPLPHKILETDSNISIEWTSRFEIDGERFVVTERTGRVRTILGYPTAEIGERCRQVTQGELRPSGISGTRKDGRPHRSDLEVSSMEEAGGLPEYEIASDDRRIDWKLATTGVATEDVLESLDLDDPSELLEAIYNFDWMIESGRFLTWEAVIHQEQGLPLSEAHEDRLDKLLGFSDCDEDRVLFIDEMPRPTEAWYETLRRLAPNLLQPVIRTGKEYYDGQIEGWRYIREVLMGHGGDLSLPPGASTPLEAVPDELRHRLELQDCLDVLVGIGQEHPDGGYMLFRDKEQHWRLDHLVEGLWESRESIAFLGLTLESLREILEFPPGDREIFEAILREKLGLGSDTEPIAGCLWHFKGTQ